MSLNMHKKQEIVSKAGEIFNLPRKESMLLQKRKDKDSRYFKNKSIRHYGKKKHLNNRTSKITDKWKMQDLKISKIIKNYKKWGAIKVWN